MFLKSDRSFFRGDTIIYNVDYGCGDNKSDYDNDEVDSDLCHRELELGQMNSQFSDLISSHTYLFYLLKV